MPNAPCSTTTPILDMVAGPKPHKKSLAGTLIGLAFGIVFAVVSSGARHTWNVPFDYVLQSYFLTVFLALVIHELGHLAAGWMVGFQFSSLTIGPFSLRLEYGRFKIQLRRSLPAGGYAGMQIKRLRRVRRRLLVFISGGPLANLLTAGICLLILAYYDPKSGWWAVFGNMLWILSAMFGVANLIPFRAGALYTDGARILMLLTSVPKARRWLCQCALAYQNRAGIQSKMWKRTWLDTLTRIRDGSVDDFSGNWTAYAAANDRKDSPVAAAHLERCLELRNSMGPSLQDLVALEAAVFSAWFRKDPVKSQKWLEQVKKPKSNPQLLQLRAKIALCCARQDFRTALSLWETAFTVIEKLPATAVKQRLLTGFLEWKDEILERERTLTSQAVPTVTTFG